MNKTSSILRKLSNKDLKEIKKSMSTGFTSYPKMGKDGRILPSQWNVWQTLQRLNVGMIQGDSESGALVLTEFGKEVGKEIK